MQLAKPVKWIEGRRENIRLRSTGLGQVGYIEVGCKNDGRITGLRYNVFADMGAYLQLLTPAIPTLTGLMLSGCYKIPAIQNERYRGVHNKMSTDAYRGAGRPEATQVIERCADLIAAELGLDPVEVRRKNFPEPTEFPFKTATRPVLRQRQLPGRAREGIDMADYNKMRAEQKKAREQAGSSASVFLLMLKSARLVHPPRRQPRLESATVRIEPTGKVHSSYGAHLHTDRVRRHRLLNS
jgi:carbon-monoxide dehydrogenase large subunit